MAEPRPISMTLRTARRLAITKQHLAGKPPRSKGPRTIMNLIRDMSYVQLDPTNVVAPSHLLVLWSRLGSFRESDLDKLLWKDRKLFEYWAHMASLVLTEDYPLYLPRMKGFHKGDRVWDKRLREWMSQNAALREYVLVELRSRGPLMLRDIEYRSDDTWHHARRRWGLAPSDWSNERGVSRMIEFLFHNGTVMVAGRQGRQRVWDLSERCLPDWTPKTGLSEAEVEYLGAQKSLKALGVATPKQIAWHYLIWRYPNLRPTIKALQSDRKILPVEIIAGPSPKGRLFIHEEDIEEAADLSKGDWEPRTTLLSPFDNLISDRDRTLWLFGFFFRTEIYTPKAKRKHGFFVLPILDGDRIIGRIDPVVDRQKEKLVINAVYAEPGTDGGKAQALRIAIAVRELADFLGAKDVVYAGKIPQPWRGYLK